MTVASEKAITTPRYLAVCAPAITFQAIQTADSPEITSTPTAPTMEWSIPSAARPIIAILMPVNSSPWQAGSVNDHPATRRGISVKMAKGPLVGIFDVTEPATQPSTICAGPVAPRILPTSILLPRTMVGPGISWPSPTPGSPRSTQPANSMPQTLRARTKA